MSAVFIHGVPDTCRVWDQVLEHLPGCDVTALALPGFGRPLPEGFAATKEEYVTWIIGELDKIGEPVDLVGHDWGCIFCVRIASLRPDLVRTWAAGSGPVSQDYEWHELAKIWQTPIVGEQWMADLELEQLSRQLEQHGVPAGLALEMAARMDETMKGSILRLYRSAVEVGKEWEPDLGRVTSPGLVFWGKMDQPCPVKFADSLGIRTSASRILKLDCAHWSPLAKPEELAVALQQHWNSTSAKKD